MSAYSRGIPINPDYPNSGRPSPNTRDTTPVINRTPSMNMTTAVTISDDPNECFAEVGGPSLHTATTEIVLQDNTDATNRNRAATKRVIASVLASGLTIALAAVSPARKTHAAIAAIPAIPAQRAIRA